MNDGDKSLVISDQNFIKIAERNMIDIVPLYYEMKKADSVILNDDEIYNGLHAAYTGGNIGSISNDITKIWNLNNIGKDELKAVKLLCLQTNFVIDYAKTLFKPTIPENVKKLFKRYSVRKTPHFFMYAKDKEKEQVEPINNSAVNRLDHYVKGKNLIYKIDRLDKFDYKMLMHNPDIIINKHLIHEYVRLNKIYHFKVNMKTSSTSNSNISYIAKEIKENLSEYCDDEKVIVDMLIKYLYGVKNSKSKESLWFCYGDVIVNNLKSNLADNKLQYCYDCGQRFRPNSPAHKYCNVCHEKYKKKNALQDQICIDCGVVFKVKSKRTKRCELCKIEHRKNYKKEKEKERRLKNKL